MARCFSCTTWDSRSVTHSYSSSECVDGWLLSLEQIWRQKGSWTKEAWLSWRKICEVWKGRVLSINDIIDLQKEAGGWGSGGGGTGSHGNKARNIGFLEMPFRSWSQTEFSSGYEAQFGHFIWTLQKWTQIRANKDILTCGVTTNRNKSIWETQKTSEALTVNLCTVQEEASAYCSGGFWWSFDLSIIVSRLCLSWVLGMGVDN